ncbi:hypothetical protein HN451_07310, partial [archaeon]|nr:hypothetical protein [archaeon]
DSKSVKYIEIAYPIDYLKDGTTFVDTPGVNDMDQQRRDVTYGYMPNSDAVIFLFDIEAPFRKSEKKFLEERVLKSNVAQLFFVANKCDRLDDDEIDHSINEINKNLSYLYPEHEFEVYPLSARNALKMRLENNESGVSRNLFKDFEDKIKTFIQGSEKIELKFKMFETQYNELVKQFSEEIDIQLNILDLSVGELENTKKLIKQSEGKFYKAFEKLLKYIDQQNLALKQRIESSLIKDYKNKEEAFIHEIDLQKGNIKEYAEKHLNYNVEKSMKTWVEQSQPFIDQNIKAIISKVLDGYRKYFSKTPIINSLHNNSLTPSSSNSIQKIELTEDYNIENISKGSMAAGAIVLGGMAIMTGGLSLAALIPAYAGGSISKNLVGGHFSKKQIETQKKELLIILPEILAKAYESLRKNTLQTLDNSIIEVKTSLNNDFNRTIEDIKETIENNINEKNKDQAGNYRKIKHLKEIFNLINKKKIYEF